MSRPDPLLSDSPGTPLGKGGTAEVVRVFSPIFNTDIALKRPLPGDSGATIPFAKLAVREQQLIMGRRFPGLVRILDAGMKPEEGLAMELCQGPTLDKVGKIESIPLAMNILSALSLDLAYLHTCGIIHADLKPHNFFLPSDWQSHTGARLFYTKLSDFAFGRFASEPETARAGLGSVGYMAPETIANGQSSHQSDLFAFGIIAYQVLSGQHPFMQEDADPVKVNSRIRETEPIPLDQLRSDIPAPLVKLVSLLLAKTPEKRPTTAWQVCELLQQCGSTYPYQRALRPSHLLDKNSDYAGIIEKALVLNSPEQERLDSITAKNKEHLRCVLACNFRWGTLRFDGTKFRFTKTIVWPNRVRNYFLQSFSKASLSTKKKQLRLALLQNSTRFEMKRTQNGSTGDDHASAMLLLPLLSYRQTKRIAHRLAQVEDNAGRYGSAARLYTFAGSLPSAASLGVESGNQLHADNRNTEAVQLLSGIIELAELRGQIPQTRTVLMTKGDILKQQGSMDPAMAVYKQIIDSYTDEKPDKLLAETYKDVGDIYKMKHQFEAGIQSLRKAQEIYDSLGDELGASHTLNNIGNMYWVASDLKSALTNYRAALRLQRNMKADAEVASTLNNIAGVYALGGRYPRAIQIYNHSLAIKKELGLGGEIARTLNNLGYVYSTSGNPQQGVACLKESLELNQRIGSKREILFNLENLGAVMIMAGRLRESLAYIKQGLELCQILEDLPRAGVLSLAKASVMKRIGMYGDAENVLGQVRAILSQIDDPGVSVEADITEAGLRYHVGDLAKAEEIATRTLSESRKLDNMQNALNSLFLLAKVSDDPSIIPDAEQLIQQLHLTRERTILMAIKLERSLQINDPNAIDRTLLATLQSAAQSMNEDIELPFICQVLARALMLAGDLKQAAVCVERGISLADKSSLLPEMAALLTIKGELAFCAKKYETAFAMFKKALQVWGQIRESIRSTTDKELFQNTAAIQKLMLEIRRLNERLGGKKEGQSHTTRLPEQ